MAYSAAGLPLCQGPSFRLACRSVSGQRETEKANAQLPSQGVVLAYPVAGLLLCQELTFHPTCQTDSYMTTRSLAQKSPLVKHKSTSAENSSQQTIPCSTLCAEDTQTDKMVASPALPSELGLQVFGQGKDDDPFALLDAHVTVQADYLHPGNALDHLIEQGTRTLDQLHANLLK